VTNQEHRWLAHLHCNYGSSVLYLLEGSLQKSEIQNVEVCIFNTVNSNFNTHLD